MRTETGKERNNVASLKDLEEGKDLPPLLTIAEACKLLGIGRDVGYRAARSGDLPTLRWGRRFFVPTARLREVIGLSAEKR
jgi:excisionase family DNA binding protein